MARTHKGKPGRKGAVCKANKAKDSGLIRKKRGRREREKRVLKTKPLTKRKKRSLAAANRKR